MLTRRQFLKVGTGGAVVLATARLGRGLSSAESETTRRPVLDRGARDVIAAIVPVMLAGALPDDHPPRATRIAATVDGVAGAVAALPPHAQADLQDLFVLLGFAPTRWMLAGVSRPWGEARAAEIGAFLEQWRVSTWALKQQAYRALHDLVMGAFYAEPANWPPIGYPGPPELD